jgi:hypothetical protein
VRYRLMASYQGSPFEAGVGPRDGDIVLFAACPPPEELGFEPATGHWRKQIPIGDVQAVWESRPVGLFRGARCMVLDDLGDRLHIGYLGHDAQQAERLGYWQVDRGVYELVAARNEVSEIVEERTEYPRKAPPRGSPPGLAEPPGYSQFDAPDYSGYPSAESSGYLSSTPAGSSPGYLPSGPIGYRAPSDSGAYSWAARPTDTGSFRRVDDTGSFARPTDTGSFRRVDDTGTLNRLGYQGGQPEAASASPAPAEEAPLPLEAAAMRAATESRRRPRPSAAQRRAAATEPAASPAPDPPPVDDQAAAIPAPEPAMVGAAQLAETPAAQAERRQDTSASPAADIQAALAAATQASVAAVAQAAAPAAPAPVAAASVAQAAQAAQAAAPVARTSSSARTTPTTVPAGPASPANLARGAQRASAPLLTEQAPTEPATPSDEAPPAAADLAGSAGAAEPNAQASETGQERQRRSARRRLATERMFSELASLAAIPVDAYAIGEEVEGALCLLQTERGFEVFHSVEGNRYELQYFSTEESACFYLFGVLAAEGVRTGSLGPHSGTPPHVRPPR